mgnify:CR=1 FL=1
MRLREARHQKFLSIRELADRAEVSTRTVVGIEQGRQVPTFKTARKIAGALEMEPAEIEEFARLMEDEPWTGKYAA